jgi:S1-C subfamily serine protease
VENAQELGYRVATTAIGATTIVEYQRKGERRETQVTMVAAPETVERQNTLIEGRTPLTGAVVANLSPAVAEELGLPPDTRGVAVTRIEGGPAQRFFKRGDIVLEVNGKSIETVDDLSAVMEKGSRLWRIAVERGGRILSLAVGG